MSQHFVEVAVRPVAAPGAASKVARQLELELGGSIKLQVDARIDPKMAAELAAIRRSAEASTAALERMSVAAAKPAAALEKTATSARSAAAAVKQLNELTARGTTEAERFGQQVGLAAKRFASFTVATAGVFALSAALSKGVGEAVAFDLALNKLRQVSDGATSEIRAMGREIGDLSVRLGVSSKELAEVSVQFAQAGLNAQQTRQALQAVAQTALAPNFENMKQTTEGAIAAFQQFGRDAGRLKEQLGAMNAVAGAFAVEAQDLVVATQKAGGSFAALGGDLNELLGLFTSVRATTRESAESIATGLRTIFARLQRQDTVDALEALRINLRYTRTEAEALGQTDLAGQFVGAYEAVRRLSEGLEGLRTTDPRFAQVTEQLGGYRQISRVIPLLQQFGEAQKAVNVARLGGVSLAINEAQRMEAVSNRITRMGEAWQKVFNDAGQSRGMQQLADVLERVVILFAKVAEVAIPLAPVLSGMAVGAGGIGAFRAFRGIPNAGEYKPHSTPPRRFAAGGLVPGVGNTDSVPMMLPEGSFVVRKAAVQAVGANNLAALGKKYAGGGEAAGTPAMVMPGEYIFPPNEARAIGYGRLYGVNAAGRGGRLPRFADGGRMSAALGFDIASLGVTATPEMSDAELARLVADALDKKLGGGTSRVSGMKELGQSRGIRKEAFAPVQALLAAARIRAQQSDFPRAPGDLSGMGFAGSNSALFSSTVSGALLARMESPNPDPASKKLGWDLMPNADEVISTFRFRDRGGQSIVPRTGVPTASSILRDLGMSEDYDAILEANKRSGGNYSGKVAGSGIGAAAMRFAQMDEDVLVKELAGRGGMGDEATAREALRAAATNPEAKASLRTALDKMVGRLAGALTERAADSSARVASSGEAAVALEAAASGGDKEYVGPAEGRARLVTGRARFVSRDVLSADRRIDEEERSRREAEIAAQRKRADERVAAERSAEREAVLRAAEAAANTGDATLKGSESPAVARMRMLREKRLRSGEALPPPVSPPAVFGAGRRALPLAPLTTDALVGDGLSGVEAARRREAAGRRSLAAEKRRAYEAEQARIQAEIDNDPIRATNVLAGGGFFTKPETGRLRGAVSGLAGNGRVDATLLQEAIMRLAGDPKFVRQKPASVSAMADRFLREQLMGGRQGDDVKLPGLVHLPSAGYDPSPVPPPGGWMAGPNRGVVDGRFSVLEQIRAMLNPGRPSPRVRSGLQELPKREHLDFRTGGRTMAGAGSLSDLLALALSPAALRATDGGVDPRERWQEVFRQARIQSAGSSADPAAMAMAVLAGSRGREGGSRALVPTNARPFEQYSAPQVVLGGADDPRRRPMVERRADGVPYGVSRADLARLLVRSGLMSPAQARNWYRGTPNPPPVVRQVGGPVTGPPTPALPEKFVEAEVLDSRPNTRINVSGGARFVAGYLDEPRLTGPSQFRSGASRDSLVVDLAGPLTDARAFRRAGRRPRARNQAGAADDINRRVSSLNLDDVRELNARRAWLDETPTAAPRGPGILNVANADARSRFSGSPLSDQTGRLFDTVRPATGFYSLTAGTTAENALNERMAELRRSIERDARAAGASRREARRIAAELADRAAATNAEVELDSRGRIVGPTERAYSEFNRPELAGVAARESATGNRRAGGRGLFGRTMSGLGNAYRGVGDFNSRLDPNGRTGALAFGAGAAGGYLAQAIAPNETQMGAVGRVAGADSRAAGGIVASSALNAAAMGAGVGAAGGPIGLVVGAVVGAGIGIATGLKDASRQIAEAKIGVAIEDLGSSLGRVTRGLNGLNDLSDVVGSVTSLRDQAAAKAASEVGSGSPLAEQRAASLKQIRLAAGPQLFQIGAALSKETDRLAKENPGLKAKDAEEKLRGSANVTALAGLLADLGVYRDTNEAFRELTKETVKASQAIKVRTAVEESRAEASRATAYLGRLAEVAERAASGLDGARDRLDVLAGGRPAPRSGADNLAAFGVDPERRAEALAGLRAQGQVGGAFADRLQDIAAAADALPEALASLAGLAPNQDAGNALSGLLGGQNRQVASALANALDEAATKDGGSLQKLLSEGVEPLARQLVGQLADPTIAQARRFEEVRGAQRQFLFEGFGRAEGLAGEARGFRSDAGRLDAQAADFARVQRARAGGFNPTDLASVRDLTSPFRASQNALLEGTGVDAEASPAALAARLREVEGARLTALGNRNTAQTATGIFEAEKELARLADVSVRVKTALENVAKSGDAAAAAQQKISAVDSSLNDRRSVAERALFADPAERAQMGRQILSAQAAARNKDGFAALDRTSQRDVIAGLNQLGTSRLPTGERADELKKVFLDQLLPGGQAGLQGKELSERAAAEKEFVEALKTQRDAVGELAKSADTRQATFLTELKGQFDRFFAQTEKGFEAAALGENLNAVQLAKGEASTANSRAQAAKFLREKLGADTDEKVRATFEATPQEIRQLVDGKRATDEELEVRRKIAERLNRNPGETFAELAAKENVQPLKLRSSYGTDAYTNADVESTSGQLITSLGFKEGSDLRKKVVEARRNDIAYNPLPFDKTVSPEVVARSTLAIAKRVLDEEDAFGGEQGARDQEMARNRYFGGDMTKFVEATGNRRSGLARYELQNRLKGLDVGRLSGLSDQDLVRLEEARKLIGGTELKYIEAERAKAEQKLREAADKLPPVDPNNPLDKIRREKLLGFAAGGWVGGGKGSPHARGTDTVPAVLAPDEFVVDARTAKANAPLLEWMRGSGRPVYRADGGFVGPEVAAMRRRQAAKDRNELPTNPEHDRLLSLKFERDNAKKEDSPERKRLLAIQAKKDADALAASLKNRPVTRPVTGIASPFASAPATQAAPAGVSSFTGGAAVGFGRPGQPVAFASHDMLGLNSLPGTTAGFGGQSTWGDSKRAGLAPNRVPPRMSEVERNRRRAEANRRRQLLSDLAAERSFMTTSNSARLAFSDEGQRAVNARSLEYARDKDPEKKKRDRRLEEHMWGKGPAASPALPVGPPEVEKPKPNGVDWSEAPVNRPLMGVSGPASPDWSKVPANRPPTGIAGPASPPKPPTVDWSRMPTGITGPVSPPGASSPPFDMFGIGAVKNAMGGGAPAPNPNPNPSAQKLPAAMDEFNQKSGRLADGFSAFGQKVDKLVEALEKIPQSIKMEATAKHEVVLNDGGLLAKLGDFEAKILAAAESMMDSRIDERVPDSLKPPRRDRNA